MKRKDKIYQKGFNDGIDVHYSWIQASIYQLVRLGILPEETNELIYEKSENLTNEEFDEYEKYLEEEYE